LKKKVLEIISKGGVKGLAHITGGGFTDNIPRVFPSGLGAKIFTGSWEVPPVFKWLQQVRANKSCALAYEFSASVHSGFSTSISISLLTLSF